jgi:hypothetical protein
MDEMTLVGENDHHPYLSIYSMSPTYIFSLTLQTSIYKPTSLPAN